MSDNVTAFKTIIFRIPDLRFSLGMILFSALLFASGFYGFLGIFTTIDVGFFTVLVPVLSLSAASIASGELFHNFLPEYPRKWAYFLSLSNLTILYLYGLMLLFTNSFEAAWNVFWLGLVTVFLSNLLVLMLTLGYQRIGRILPLSFVQPVGVLILFHFFLGGPLNITLGSYLLNFGVVVLSGILLLMVFGLFEYLLRANSSGISILKLTSGLLQKKQEALDLGYPSRPDVQTFEVDNGESYKIAAPWVHPGPLEGFGGGNLSSHIISSLNNGKKGFFFHVPSSHKSDPADPKDSEKLLEALKSPEKHSKASKMIKREYGNIKYYGRRYGDSSIVFLEAEKFGKYDDFDVSIFNELIDPEKTIVVDLHSHDRNDYDVEECWYGTEDAEKLRTSFKEFVEELEAQPLYTYSAGFHVNDPGSPMTALVEGVDEQKTLLLGVEGNGISEKMREKARQQRKDFNKVVVFSTDTHASIHEMSSEKTLERSEIDSLVDTADQNLKEASAGITSSKAKEMKLLREDYMSLIFSINILIRLIPLSLILVFLGLAVWML
ncbi:MAG: DUF2070 family protein [Nanohaloarchaea archaeon]|nr:DUF2070 family protein [Candidatus Nanohaloarchaea archaeon]